MERAVQDRTDDVVVRLDRSRGSYAAPRTLDGTPTVVLRALVNPAQTRSLITAESLDELKRWEIIDLGVRDAYRLGGVSIQGQPIPAFDVWSVPRAAHVRGWDVILGANFFRPYSDIHLNLASAVARLIAG
jgi:hypothetical protein